MTNTPTIDGVSRALLEDILLRARHGFVSKASCDALRAILAAPVVERQEPVVYLRNEQDEGGPNNLVICGFTEKGAFGVYRAPPQLAELQAEIERLRSTSEAESKGADRAAESMLYWKRKADELQSTIERQAALLDRVVTEVGRTITPELRHELDAILNGEKP